MKLNHSNIQSEDTMNENNMSAVIAEFVKNGTDFNAHIVATAMGIGNETTYKYEQTFYDEFSEIIRPLYSYDPKNGQWTWRYHARVDGSGFVPVFHRYAKPRKSKKQ